MSESRCYIYCITNSVNGKRYIGIARDPAKRWAQHKSRAKRGRYFINLAIAKYGVDSFTFNVVACCQTWDDGLELERRLIAELNCRDRENGYNLTSGGEGVPGLVHSAETRAKLSAQRLGVKLGPPSEKHRAALSAAMKGKAPAPEVLEAALAFNKGRKFTEDQRLARSAQLTGRPVSDETRTKLRMSNLGQKRSEAACEANRASQLGKKHTPEQSAAKSARQTGRKIKPRSDEQRAAISAAQLGKPRGPYSPEHCAAISAATKGRVVSAATRALISAANLGRKLSDETRAKMSATRSPLRVV